MLSKVRKAVDYIKDNIDEQPLIGLILGSGLGYLADKIENAKEIKYENIPFFPSSTVKGHEGKIVVGNLEGIPVIALKGRFHAYEGISMKKISFPIYVMKEIGVKGLILTNAAGGINRTYNPGDIIANVDFINLSMRNPLIGPNYEELGPRFVPMANPIDKNWLNSIIEQSSNQNIEIKKGTYAWFLGPTYETPAEIKMAEKFQADLVGMSTMPEVISANHAGIRVVSFSACTNMAAGILPEPLNHEDVVRVADRIKTKFENVLKIALKMF